jgi:hypothetical protein
VSHIRGGPSLWSDLQGRTRPADLWPSGDGTPQRARQRVSARRQPFRRGKVVRWLLTLTDEQIVELTRRLQRCLHRHDGLIRPERLREVLLDFATNLP